MLFLLGEKGKAVLQYVVENNLQNVIDTVVIGSDSGTTQDYFQEISELCLLTEIRYQTRDQWSTSTHSVQDVIGVAAGWRWLIGEPFKHLVIIHDSLLPKYRGFNPLVTALINGDAMIGATALLAEKEFDRGPILCQVKTEISYPIRINDAIKKMSILYKDLAGQLFELFSSSTAPKGDAQDETIASYSLWRDEDDYLIDWSKDSTYLLRFINALGSPYRGAKTFMNGNEISITSAEIIEDVDISNRNPGKVLFLDEGIPTIACGSGLLRILEAFDSAGNSVIPLRQFRTRFGK